MAKKKLKKLPLSVRQLETLISISIRNSLDVVGGELDGGYRFMIALDCLEPADCIPHSQVPDGEDEYMAILECHGVVELYPFLANIMGLKKDGEAFRAVETIVVDSNNVEEFLEILDEMCSYWDSIMDEEEKPVDLKGKNVIEGNGTVN